MLWLVCGYCYRFGSKTEPLKRREVQTYTDKSQKQICKKWVFGSLWQFFRASGSIDLILCWQETTKDAKVARVMSEEEEWTSLQGAFISTQVRGNQGRSGNSKSGNKLKNALTALLKHNTISVPLIPSWNCLPNCYGSRFPGSVSFYADAVSEKLRLFGFATLDAEKKVRYPQETPYWVQVSARVSCRKSYLSLGGFTPVTASVWGGSPLWGGSSVLKITYKMFLSLCSVSRLQRIMENSNWYLRLRELTPLDVLSEMS